MSSLSFETLWKFMEGNSLEVVGERVPDNLLCVICGRLLIRPYVAECGCHFCMSCLVSFLAQDQRSHCPGLKEVCKEFVLEMETNVLRDLTTQFNIANTWVKCPNKPCSVRLQMDKMVDHVESCDMKPVSCPFLTIGCTHDRIFVNTLGDHFRSQEKHHCTLITEALQTLKSDMEGQGRNGSQQSLEVEKLKEEMEYLKEENENTKAEIQGLKNELEIYRRENMGLREDKKDMRKLKEEMERRMERCEMWMNERDEEARMTREKIAELLQYDAQKVCDLGEMKEEVETMERKVRMMESEVRRMEEKEEEGRSEMRVLRQEMTKCHKEVEKMDERMEHLVLGAKYDLVWTIYDLVTKRNWFQSDPFYKDGYKVCLRGWIGGFLGIYFKLYFCLMRGDHDSTLSWPMRHTVTLAIMNGDQTHTSWRCNYHSFGGDKSVFERPRTQVNEYVGGPWMYLKEARNIEGVLLANGAMRVTCVMHPPLESS